MTKIYRYRKEMQSGLYIKDYSLSTLINIPAPILEELGKISKPIVLSYPSPFITSIAENDLVHAELFMNHNKNNTLLILLHGFSSKLHRLRNYYDFIASALNQGINCAFLNMPFHLQRTPAGEISGERLIYFDDIHTLEFYHQAVVDTKRLIDIVQDSFGFKRIILCGFSLGSMVSTISIATDCRINKGILVFGGGNWFEIHWNSTLAYILKGNCMQDGEITKEKCSLIYKDFPDFLKEFKTTDMELIDFELSKTGSLKDKTTRKCFLCDPLAFGHKISPEKILILGSKLDHFFTKNSVIQLHNEIGNPEIHWFNRIHSSAILADNHAKTYIFDFIKDNRYP